MREKEILEIVQNPKDSADFNDESDGRFNDAVPMTSTSEMRKLINDSCCFLDVQSNGEMNKQTEDLE